MITKLSGFVVFVLVLCTSCFSQTPVENQSKDENDDPHARAQYELMRLRDPQTGRVPAFIKEKELAFARSVPAKETLAGLKRYNGRPVRTVNAIDWSRRGPINVGGRTRALAVDATNGNIILAGGVSGGMWRSTDGGSSWSKVTEISELQSVTCIVQDTRAGHTNVWYYGTGENWGNSASADGSGPGFHYTGNGIFKSTDNGISWNLLPATASNTPQTMNQFDLIYSLALDPSNPTNDIIYAACFGGIFRSTDGGDSWGVTLGDSGAAISLSSSFFTDVTVSSAGIAYAAMSQGNAWSVAFGADSSSLSKGIYRSTDGVNWVHIEPAGWPPKYNRVVLDIPPSNGNVLYVLGDTPGSGLHVIYGGADNYTSFWKYTYVSGDGSGAGGSWLDRTGNLPTGGSGGTFAHQRGYDLVITSKPDAENVVFIGGVNMFRSTDGFASTSNTTWIGGWYVGAGGTYTNHHADQHAMVFLPGDPSSMLSGNDGGVYRTTNDLAATVVWDPLNIGYETSQFYTVAIDHGTPGNNIIVGGTQDNGTQFTGSDNPSDYWKLISLGDGAACAIADGRSSYYTSSQNGVAYRRILDDNGNQSASTRIDPTGGSGYSFISPFALDPNDTNMMYLVGGTSLWRNNNLTGIPLFSNATTSVGWTHLTNSTVGSGVITALGVSTAPANRVYYGTSGGIVFRLDSANAGNPVPVNVTGASFPGGALVNCVAVDPSDADRAITVFSNYSVKSLFYTSNGGTTWTDVSGNLEQFPDGSGYGPSCRWATIVPSGGYFIGTSTGLYSTAELNGASTVWALEGSANMGNVVVDAIDARMADGRIVAATHGNGIYSGFAVVAPPPVPVLVSPSDDALNRPPVLKLRWNIALAAATYHLQVSTDSTFGTTFVDDSTLTDTSRIVGGLGADMAYYWRVNAKNILGESGWSAVRSFVTADTSAQLAVLNGWNLISVPFGVADNRTSTLFPGAVSNAFAYEGGYTVKESLSHGVGYWLKFGAAGSVLSSGVYLTAETIAVSEGWNLIGSISAPIAVSTIGSDTAGMIVSQFFGYTGSYVTRDSVTPGAGYWVKTSRAGSLILSTTAAAASKNLRIVRIAELPPAPPDDRLDAAFLEGSPRQFSLEQNYPNPFNPLTTIRYSIPSDSRITLVVYNLLGEEVARIVDEVQHAGLHEATWPGADGTPSGVYYYRLTAGSYAETRKFLILK
ncbi:MAG TPA: T9SS type A sorting domain-containing protein [Bacteroidota bacterium]|jgi:photosystem II stability/assembly factor-like uncharacterized protein|nr:T9SS type A sorting domain-containing protein [Bacteroidota bacterium]